MADDLRMALQDVLRKAQLEGNVDFLREGAQVLAQALMELEVPQHVGAERQARSPERTGQRNGYRERQWDTRVGTLDLGVPRVRDGSYFPALVEPRRRAERALVAVVQEAYVQGVSTRRVDELVQALGLQGVSKSQVSVLCQELDGEVERFRTRPLTALYPYVWLDATFVKVRQDGRVVSAAVVLATGVNATTGLREVLGLDGGPSEDGAFWLGFLRSLVARGLSGVQQVSNWASQTPMKGSRRRLARCCTARAGSAAVSTSCATPSPWCPRARRRWSPPPSAPSLPSRMLAVPASRGGGSLTASVSAIPAWPTCSMPPRRMCSPTWPSRRSMGARSGATIRSNGSIARSSAARTWSASSPTRRRLSAWWARCSPSSMTSGRWAGATSAPSPSPS